MDKEAIIPELARLGSHIVGRSSAATAATEGAVRGSIGRLQAGAKGFLNAPIKGTPEIMPAAARGFVRKATDVAIENPALALGFATPVPFGGPLLYGAQKVVEKGINKLVPPKLAFAVSQYSGALNPVIHSGASVIPPFKAPRLDVAVQKAAFAQTYSAGPSPDWAHGPATAASDIPPFRAPRLDKAIQKSAAGAPTRGNFMMASDVPPFKAPRLDRAIQKDGAYESEPYTSIFKGAKLVKLEGDAIIECDKQGKSLGKGNLLKEKDSDALPDSVALQPWDSFKRSKYAATAEQLRQVVARLPGVVRTSLGPMGQHGSTIFSAPGGAMRSLAETAGSPKTLSKLRAFSPEGKKAVNAVGVLHEAAERRARRIPAVLGDVLDPKSYRDFDFSANYGHRSPEVILTENNALAGMTGAGADEARRAYGSLRRGREAAELQQNIASFHPQAAATYGEYGQAKLPKAFRKNLMKDWQPKHAYAMPTEKLAEFVEGLLKEAIPGLTPQSRLEQSTRIGAPRATPPPGPSIAMQSKPTGFGTPIAGAQKGSIGGGSFATSGMKPPPQIGMG